MIGHDNRVTAPKIPQYHELMWPALQATKELGGSATVSEMNERAMASAGITEEQQAVPHGEDGRMSEVEYRLHWARTHLKGHRVAPVRPARGGRSAPSGSRRRGSRAAL